VKRPLILGVVGLLLLAAALGINLVLNRKDQATAPEPTVAAAPTGAPTTAPSVAAAAPRPPSFDIVRINPQGDAVIAGRATPEAQVHVLDGEREIGSVTADQRGEWVLLPSEPLPSGHRELSLLAEPPGAPPVRSEPVVVEVAPRGTATRDTRSADIGSARIGSTAGQTAGQTDAQAVVEPGNSLWGLARQRYGHGAQYGAILQANRRQIRDPDLIYPGQIFVMPPGP
jgi:nucleoid-associated protein YgaU